MVREDRKDIRYNADSLVLYNIRKGDPALYLKREIFLIFRQIFQIKMIHILKKQKAKNFRQIKVDTLYSIIYVFSIDNYCNIFNFKTLLLA